MEHAWYLISFDREDFSAEIECELDASEITDLAQDITKLTSMALENNCRKATKEVSDDNVLSYRFFFLDEGGWKTFCTNFIKLFKEEQK
ncbi:MAG: hypothetical protein IJE68_03460 [Clostridia bacterium]|nr:hypothetical protein [Clostridia bacterium]